MEVEEDVEHVAQWLGSIVKPEYFNAFYHKPSVSTTFCLFRKTFPPISLSSLVCGHMRAMEDVCSVLAPIVVDVWRLARITRASDIDAVDVFVFSY